MCEPPARRRRGTRATSSGEEQHKIMATPPAIPAKKRSAPRIRRRSGIRWSRAMRCHPGLIGTIHVNGLNNDGPAWSCVRQAALAKKRNAPLSMSSLCELFVRFVTHPRSPLQRLTLMNYAGCYSSVARHCRTTLEERRRSRGARRSSRQVASSSAGVFAGRRCTPSRGGARLF